MSTVREVVLDPSEGVWLGYGNEVGGFDGEARDISKRANGWKNIDVDIQQQEPPLAVGDYVVLVVQVSPKKTRRIVGWVEDMAPIGLLDPTPVGIHLGLKDEEHKRAMMEEVTS